MGCRCTDIDNVNSQLTRLLQAENELAYYQTHASGMNVASGNVAGYLRTTVCVGFSKGASERTSRIATLIADAAGATNTKIKDRYRALKNELQRITMEDKHYHEEEERLRLEEQRKQEEEA